jgi:hypothetical protein
VRLTLGGLTIKVLARKGDPVGGNAWCEPPIPGSVVGVLALPAGDILATWSPPEALEVTGHGVGSDISRQVGNSSFPACPH